MTTAESVLLMVFIAWFSLTALRQTRGRLARRLTDWDVAGTLPVWRFFAPMPGCFDYHLLVRDLSADGTITDWSEVPGWPRRGWNVVWNPGKRLRKGLLDVATALIQEQERMTPEAVRLSVPYLVLLNYISRLPRQEVVERRQFLLMVSSGYEIDLEPEILCLSGIHRVEP